MDGEILGAIVRIPQGGDLRSNIHVGGKVVRGEITDADRRIVERVTPQLREDGLYFVGLDVIGGKLTEVNVTSPTGIQQMSRLDGRNCEAPVIDWIERASRASPPSPSPVAADRCSTSGPTPMAASSTAASSRTARRSARATPTVRPRQPRRSATSRAGAASSAMSHRTTAPWASSATA